MAEGSVIPAAESGRDDGSLGPGSAGLNLGSALAEGAMDRGARAAHDALLAGIEARLADEVRGLVASLEKFGRRTQLISKELPDRAHFSKAVTGFLSLLGFQFAYALGKDLDSRILLDDGAEYLRKLGLRGEDLFCELSLDGRRYVAIACIDDNLGDSKHGTDGGNE